MRQPKTRKPKPAVAVDAFGYIDELKGKRLLDACECDPDSPRECPSCERQRRIDEIEADEVRS